MKWNLIYSTCKISGRKLILMYKLKNTNSHTNALIPSRKRQLQIIINNSITIAFQSQMPLYSSYLPYLRVRN